MRAQNISRSFFHTLYISALCNLLVLSLCVGYFFSQTAHAQFTASTGSTELSLSGNLAYPLPNTDITVSAESSITDIGTAHVTWYINDRKAESGTGMTTFTTKLGEVGSVTTIKAVAVTRLGETLSGSKTFRPASVDLVWESGSYTPPFYKGKALVTAGSPIRVVALPQLSGSSLNDTQYTFTWTIDGKVLSNESGFGKNVLSVNATVANRPLVIGVTVSTADKRISAKNAITIRSTQPTLIVYPFNVAYGTMLNRAITDTIAMTEQEISFSAVPYFTSASNFSYQWSVNNTRINEIDSVVTLRKSPEEKGEATLRTQAIINGTPTNEVNLTITF
jgi:hypothetical protein